VSSAGRGERHLLLDASVWLAALDRDDSFHPAAQQLIEAAAAGTATLAALDLTLYEVANVAVVRWRSTADAGRLVTLVRLACPETLERADEELLGDAAAIAGRHGLTVYDGAYVAAARRGWTLVSGDVGDLVRPGLATSPEDAVRDSSERHQLPGAGI
jgi:predicted nucleic acid-binding protein